MLKRRLTIFKRTKERMNKQANKQTKLLFSVVSLIANAFSVTATKKNTSVVPIFQVSYEVT